jgi:aldehyde:ferredoxin oxidoreductase
VIACGRVVRLEDGDKRKGPEYETMVGFGPNLMLNDLVLTVRLGELCDRYGLDSISMSNTLGLAYRLFELGKIGLSETGGLPLTWGDGSGLEELINQTVQRRGFGAHLAQGAHSLAKAFDAEEEAVQVNGLELAYHDPRGASGMALVYATSPRGACHNQSDYLLVDIGQVESELGLEFFDRQGGVEKAANVARHQDWRTLANALVMCLFANVAPHDVLALINAACGTDYTLDDILRCGERGWNLKRLLNIKLGLSAKNDCLPTALLHAYADDPQGEQGYAPPLEPMLAAYYLARGWDASSGIPAPEKLDELNLSWAQPGK